MWVCVASLQNGSSKTIATFSNTPKPTREMTRRLRFGSRGSNWIAPAFRTPSGTVTTTCDPCSRRRRGRLPATAVTTTPRRWRSIA